MPREYWCNFNQKKPLQNKIYIVIDEIFGPLAAKWLANGTWRACHGVDPENVKYFMEFEWPN